MHKQLLIVVGVIGTIALSFVIFAFVKIYELTTPPAQDDLVKFAAKSACHREQVLDHQGTLTKFDLGIIEDKCHTRNLQTIIRGNV
jgi:hypothetical protein